MDNFLFIQHDNKENTTQMVRTVTNIRNLQITTIATKNRDIVICND